MERRSRSQTRRAGELSVSSRHTSSSRDIQPPLSLPYSRPPDQARTLSPDRRDRYRASYRDSLPHHPPSSVPHSNSNSYNQYNHPYPLNHQTPRQQPYNNNNVPPRPEPPTYTTTPTASQPSVSPNKPANNLPADKQGGERIAWEFHHITLQRVPNYGFGIAVSGGRDNPHFTNGDPSIAISDVLKGGPAEGKLMINDRVISAGGASLEGVDYATAVQVLRDSGHSVNLVVKRRVVLPSPPEPQTVKVSLYKNKKKEDFGIVLGCKIYIKEISSRSVADKDGNLQDGDIVQRINNVSLDGLSLKEARKLLDAAKDRLDVTVKRDPYKNSSSNRMSPQGKVENEDKNNQNLYVPPPSRKDEKNNLVRAEEMLENGAPPRPPLPRDEGFEGNNSPSEAGTLPISDKQNPERQTSEFSLDLHPTNGPAEYNLSPRKAGEESSLNTKNKGNLPDPRFISFKKEGSVGIRLTGGNDVGIFVTAVQPGSPAAQQGLQPGDKIIKVNDMDMSGVTREEAVLFLLSLQDQIDLIAQYRKDEYDQIVQLQRGDSFYIRAHFNYDQNDKGEMNFKKSDVFHVVDTLHNGVVGSWQAFRMDPFLSGLGRAAEQVQKGVIPNKSRAEEIATQQFNAAKKEQSVCENNKSSFFKRRKAQNHRRSKSLGKDHWEDLVWSESMSKFPAYERVSLRHPGFPRPVVIFGPVADLVRERLLRDFPLKFASPQLDSTGEGSKSGIVRLSAIRDIMEKGKHALLDVTPNAVDKLNYAQFYPIVILTRADSKQTIKDCRTGVPKKAHMSSKKLLEQCQKLEKLWGHVLTGTLQLHSDNWYTKVTDLLEKQQTAPIWMSDTKPEESFSDDFLFPMTSRLSYTSAAESDGEFCGEDLSPRRAGTLKQDPSGRLVRTSSDPSLAREAAVKPPDSLPPPPYTAGHQTETKRRSQGGDSKYGFPKQQQQQQDESEKRPGKTKKSDGGPVPVLPPKIDRQKKPSKKSAAERLFGRDREDSSPADEREVEESPGYHSMPPVVSASNGVSERQPETNGTVVSKKNTYDSNSSSNFDSYNKHETGYAGYSRSLSQPAQAASSPYSGGGGNKTSANTGPSPYAGGNNKFTPTSQPSDKYRYSDYKPLPPPKTTIYKPVPPPKPKASSRSNSQPPSMTESNYMNGNYMVAGAGGSPGEAVSHYHSSRVAGIENGYASTNGNGTNSYSPSNGYRHTNGGSNGQHSLHNGHPMTNGGHVNGYDDHDSNGVDSGQGSSLDRDYSSYNGQYSRGERYSGQSGVWGTGRDPHSGGTSQYYYNLPHTGARGEHGGGETTVSNNNNSPRRRAPGDTLDIANREYRGSAFELYKKPGYSIPSSYQQ